MGSTHWTKADKDALATLYPDTPNDVLGRVFGKTPKAIGLMARSLGVTKSEQFMRNHPTRIRPGEEPWNKGVKGSTGTQQGCRQTQFKAGRPANESRNYKPIGSTRITKDGYLEQKVTDDRSLVPARRWVAVHRLVWERNVGPIPCGHIVVFKAGALTVDVEQITADRLECITRHENMMRNTCHRYGKEVAQLIQLRGAINRQIRKREKEQGHEHQ